MEQAKVSDQRAGVVCPIDQQACEGANGPMGTHMCWKQCKAGKHFIDAITGASSLRRRPDAPNPIEGAGARGHGTFKYAHRNKCECPPCLAARARNNAKKRKQERARRARIRAANPPVKTISHGKRYAWYNLKCECLPCLDAKRKWQINNNKKKREARERDRVLRSANRTEATQEHSNDCLIAS